jgi:dihydroxy-acid dehydratase
LTLPCSCNDALQIAAQEPFKGFECPLKGQPSLYEKSSVSNIPSTAANASQPGAFANNQPYSYSRLLSTSSARYADEKLNKVSATITQPKSQGASQAMLYATGLTDADLSKAQVGISSVWYEGNPCNMHLMDLAGLVKESVAKAGLVPYRFNTIGVSDGISMGTTGMRYSLQSREIIADSIETVMNGQWYELARM